MKRKLGHLWLDFAQMTIFVIFDDFVIIDFGEVFALSWGLLAKRSELVWY